MGKFFFSALNVFSALPQSPCLYLPPFVNVSAIPSLFFFGRVAEQFANNLLYFVNKFMAAFEPFFGNCSQFHWETS